MILVPSYKSIGHSVIGHRLAERIRNYGTLKKLEFCMFLRKINFQKSDAAGKSDAGCFLWVLRYGQ